MHATDHGLGETTLDASTQDSGDEDPLATAARLILTISHHPDGRRVGEFASLAELAGGLPVALSRLQPAFCTVSGNRQKPLEHPRLSRAPVWLRIRSKALSITPARADLRVTVDDKPVTVGCQIPLEQVRERGVFIALGGSVLLWLAEMPEERRPLSEYGIYGVSSAIRTLFDAVERVARLTNPVLIRGEQGVGKELIGRAIHQLSDRRHQPFIKANMAAIPADTAAAELFGDARGGTAGAPPVHVGHLARAHRGTLYLNAIGDAPEDIQPLLLRVLESGEIQPVGATSQTVDIRFIGATETDLEVLVNMGKFRPALFYRLQSAILDVPPLRERRADIPLLLHHFLREHLREFAAESLLDDSVRRDKRREWLRLKVVARLMRYSFPGNVRELRNIASQIAIHNYDQPHASLPRSLAENLEAESSPESAAVSRSTRTRRSVATKPQRPPTKPPVRSKFSLSDEVVRETLRQHEWNLTQTARALGISKNALSVRMRHIPNVRLADRLTREEILEAQTLVGNDVATMAGQLEVSVHALRLRMRELDMS